MSISVTILGPVTCEPSFRGQPLGPQYHPGAVQPPMPLLTVIRGRRWQFLLPPPSCSIDADRPRVMQLPQLSHGIVRPVEIGDIPSMITLQGSSCTMSANACCTRRRRCDPSWDCLASAEAARRLTIQMRPLVVWGCRPRSPAPSAQDYSSWPSSQIPSAILNLRLVAERDPGGSRRDGTNPQSASARIPRWEPIRGRPIIVVAWIPRCVSFATSLHADPRAPDSCLGEPNDASNHAVGIPLLSPRLLPVLQGPSER
jgi:hypothetical protein